VSVLGIPGVTVALDGSLRYSAARGFRWYQDEVVHTAFDWDSFTTKIQQITRV
jgi:hypothetical protein